MDSGNGYPAGAVRLFSRDDDAKEEKDSLPEKDFLMKRLLIFLIIFYRKYLSLLKMPTCRFYPTCSAYALESIIKKGVCKGLIASLKRILRCHPLNKGGYDPVE
jgi:putative membrane protein insertion efficiency factor